MSISTSSSVVADLFTMESIRKSSRLHSNQAAQKPQKITKPRMLFKNSRVLKREVSSPDESLADVSQPILQSPSLDDVETLGKSNNIMCDEESTSTDFIQNDSIMFGINSQTSFHSGFPPNYIPPYPIISNPTNQTLPITSYMQTNQQAFADQLQLCIRNDVLDIYKIGKLIHEAYLHRHSTIVDDCKTFALKNYRRITSFTMPPPSCYADHNIHMILLHGQLVYSMLSRPSVPTVTVMSTESEREYKKLHGAIFRTRHLKFNFPSIPPFSGLPMKLESVPMERKSMKEAHIVLKTYIFQLLSTSCKFPTDIQKILWSLPHDNCYSTHTPFPPTLYNDMRDIFLNFFGINEIELENGQWDDKFISLDCLQSYDSPIMKKKKFQSLAAARAMFMSKEGYHKCLREAITEIRCATYSPPSPTQPGIIEREMRAVPIRNTPLLHLLHHNLHISLSCGLGITSL